jgi:hypothetical protein
MVSGVNFKNRLKSSSVADVGATKMVSKEEFKTRKRERSTKNNNQNLLTLLDVNRVTEE